MIEMSFSLEGSKYNTIKIEMSHKILKITILKMIKAKLVAKIRFVMFYTPQMQVFTMTESFKKANFKNFINISFFVYWNTF